MSIEMRKFQARVAELAPYRYRQRMPIGEWQVVEDLTKQDKYPSDRVQAEEKPFKVGDRWEGRDYYLWISTEFVVPTDSESLVLLFDFGKTGGGHNSGFESLLFINNEPYQGVDSNHQEVFLPPEMAGQTLQLSLKLWSGLEGGGPKTIQEHRFLCGDMAILDVAVDDFYYTLDVLVKTIELLDENDPTRVTLVKTVAEALATIDWSQPGSQIFYDSLVRGNKVLQQRIDVLPKNTEVKVTAIGHTHIDVAWLWRLKHTREKASRSFSTVLRLMEQYPDYVFLQTQPQLYAYIKEDYPEIYAQIKERVAEGRWEIDGGMWLEADCNIPSGESFVRQFLYGSQFIKKEFNKQTEYLWLPDVFGYSWALPQILKKSGIKTFMTTKISWNQFNRMPHDTFIWKGIDGSEILTHFVTTPEISEETGSDWRYTYNGMIEPATVKGIYDTYRDKEINDNLLLSYGFGDGGGGVNREMLEKRRRINKIPGLPKLETGRADEFFQNLHQTIEETEGYVHKWDGELYLEYHRGTYTSQAYVKKMNRLLELRYRELEILVSLLVDKEEYESLKSWFDQGWTIILRNQFHDIIPGSSIEEVYQDNKREYEVALKIADKIEEAIINLSHEPEMATWTVYNTASWPRKELIQVAVEGEGHFVGEDGQRLLAEKTAKGYLVGVPMVGPISSQQIHFKASQPQENLEETAEIDLVANQLETTNYLIKWQATGQLSSIYDKLNQREVLKEEGFGNYLKLYEDKPIDYDAWDIDIFYKEKSRLLDASSIQVTANNGFLGTVCFTYEFGQSTISQYMTVYRESRRIDFKTEVDWKERQQLLKTHFDVAVRNNEATYDIQYGSVKRPTHWNTSWDSARFESVAHQWIDFSERSYGVSLLNDSKYGHSVKEQTMTLSLLKGGIYPDPLADVGHHSFTYSLLPHAGDFIEGQTVEEAWQLNNPLSVLPGAGKIDSEFVIISNQCVIIDAIKVAESGQGIVLRLHEHTGDTRQVKLRPNFYYSSWSECNLMEDRGGFEMTDQEISFTLKPYEIKTFIFH